MTKLKLTMHTLLHIIIILAYYTFRALNKGSELAVQGLGNLRELNQYHGDKLLEETE